MFIVSSSTSTPFYCGMSGFAAALQTCQSAALSGQKVAASASRGLSRSGKLCRSLSISSHDSTSSFNSTCIAQARQIELDFSGWGAPECTVTVRAPTGEESAPMCIADGTHQRFSPVLAGCGHGVWTIRVETADMVKEQTISLEGVGSLFFTIDHTLTPRLTSQEFLVLPHTSLCSAF